MFYGRENERKKLHRMFLSDGQMISLIYGRRRIGKSELIKQFFFSCTYEMLRSTMHRINDFRIGGLFVIPKNDFLDKNSFNKTSSMINLWKRAEIESP